jgi:16S rRNA (cytosine1402-N4)-methyltransferase
MSITLTHKPVLLEEVLQGLEPGREGIYIDCTFGRGGHTRALLERLGPEGKVFGLDKDPEAASAGAALACVEPRFSMQKASFGDLEQFTRAQGIFGKVNGILFDLGVSSPQLEDPDRGFSFFDDGPLDMRMDPETGPSAAAWLARASEQEIAWVLQTYGEERYARRIAHALVRERAGNPIATTRRLSEIAVRAIPAGRPSKGSRSSGHSSSRRPRGVVREKHPATRTFQAIRIFINHELEELAAGLQQTLGVLAPRGRLAAISFHSLEDRLVKRFIRAHSRIDPPLLGLPLPPGLPPPPLRSLGGPRRPGEQEIEDNPRARSAILRLAEKYLATAPL